MNTLAAELPMGRRQLVQPEESLQQPAQPMSALEKNAVGPPDGTYLAEDPISKRQSHVEIEWGRREENHPQRAVIPFVVLRRSGPGRPTMIPLSESEYAGWTFSIKMGGLSSVHFEALGD